MAELETVAEVTIRSASAWSRFNLRVVVVADVARLRGILERTEFWRIRLPESQKLTEHQAVNS